MSSSIINQKFRDLRGNLVQILSPRTAKITVNSFSETVPILGRFSDLSPWSKLEVSSLGGKRILLIHSKGLGGGACCSTKPKEKDSKEEQKKQSPGIKSVQMIEQESHQKFALRTASKILREIKLHCLTGTSLNELEKIPLCQLTDPLSIISVLEKCLNNPILWEFSVQFRTRHRLLILVRRLYTLDFLRSGRVTERVFPYKAYLDKLEKRFPESGVLAEIGLAEDIVVAQDSQIKDEDIPVYTGHGILTHAPDFKLKKHSPGSEFLCMVLIDQMFYAPSQVASEMFNQFMDLSLHTNWYTLYSSLYYIEHAFVYDYCAFSLIKDPTKILVDLLENEEIERRVREQAYIILYQIKSVESQIALFNLNRIEDLDRVISNRQTIDRNHVHSAKVLCTGIDIWNSETENKEIAQALDYYRTIVICGPRGSGKSCLAESLAMHSQYEYVFYIDCEVSLDYSIGQIATLLNVPWHQDIDKRLSVVFKALGKKKAVFIVDNTDSFEYKDLFVQSRFPTIITSTSRNWLDLYIHEIDKDKTFRAKDVFLHIAKVEPTEKFMKELDYNLNTIALCAHYIQRKNCSLEEYCEILNSQYNGSSNIEKILLTSLDFVKKLNKDAHILLEILLVLYPKRINKSIYVLLLNLDEYEVLQARFVLEDLGLITTDSHCNISLSKIVHKNLLSLIRVQKESIEKINIAFLSILEIEKEKDQGFLRFFEVYKIYKQAQLFISQYYDPRFIKTILRFYAYAGELLGTSLHVFHLEELKAAEISDPEILLDFATMIKAISGAVSKPYFKYIAKTEEKGQEYNRAIQQLGIIENELKQYPKAQNYLEKAIHQWTAFKNRPHPILSRCNLHLGIVHYRTDNYEEALEYIEISLNDCEILNDLPLMIQSLYWKAQVFRKRREYSLALILYEKSLQMAKETLGEHQGVSGLCYVGIAECKFSNGLVNEALNDCRSGLEMLSFSPKAYRLSVNIHLMLEKIEEGYLICEEAFKLADKTDNQKEIGKIGILLAKILFIKKDHRLSLDLYEKSLLNLTSVYEGAQPVIAETLLHMSEAYLKINEPQEAALGLKKAREMYNEIYEHESVALINEKLGDICLLSADKERALKMYLRSLVIHRETPKNYFTPKIMHKIGLLLESMKRHADAYKIYEEELEILQSLNSPEKDIGNCYLRMGTLHKKRNFTKCLDFYYKALSLLENKPKILYKIAGVEDTIGLFLESKKHYLEILSSHIDLKLTAKTLKALGSLCNDENSHEEALDYYQEALQIQQKLYGHPSAEVAHTLYCIGLTLGNLQQLDRAINVLEKSLDLSSLAKGEKHLMNAYTLNMIAKYYYDLGKFEKSLEFFQQSLSVLEETAQGEVSLNLYNQGVIYDKLGIWDDSLACYNRALEMLDKTDKQAYARILNNIGVVYDKQEFRQLAEEQFDKALKIQKQIFAESNLDVARTYRNLGVVLDEAGQFEKALNHSKESLRILQKFLKEQNMELTTTQNNIELVTSHIYSKV